MSAMIDAKTRLDFPVLRDARYPVHRIAAQVEPYLRAIVERCHPEKIILFGSQVCGDPGEHSDVDLLVVRRGIVSERESNLEMRCAFDEIPGVPPAFTLLSKTPERIVERLAARSAFYEDIVVGGLTVYAA